VVVVVDVKVQAGAGAYWELPAMLGREYVSEYAKLGANPKENSYQSVAPTLMGLSAKQGITLKININANNKANIPLFMVCFFYS
jgi:hypothetical protein